MIENKELINKQEEIDLSEIFLLIWDYKIFIAFVTSFFAIGSIIYSLSIPNKYNSFALLAASSEKESLASNIGQFSGLAGLAGINLPSDNGSKSEEAKERIKSFDFFKDYFLPFIKLEDLMAVKEWKIESDTIIYDESIFDVESNKWVRKVDYPKQATPSQQESYTKYLEILKLSTNNETGFISLSIIHESPFVANQWVDLIILNINNSMREIDKKNAEKSINFLNETSKTTSIKSIQEAISKLLEIQMQTLMLASSNEEYVFKVIDSPRIPEIKSSPDRALICIIGTLLGLFLSSIFVLIKYYLKSSRS